MKENYKKKFWQGGFAVCSRLKGMLNKKRFLQCTRTFFIGQTGFGPPAPPSLALLARFKSWRMLAHSIVKKKSTVLKTVDSEKLFIGQTGFEPATSTSRTSRATSCAIARKKNVRNCSVAGCDLNVPNLKIEEPLRKIAKTWSNFLGSTYRQRATSCAIARKNVVLSYLVAWCDSNIPNM